MAIVLVPGFMVDDDLWSDIVEDLRPFGPFYYADPSRANSIEEMAAETLKLAPSRFILIGFSMGGYVARAMQRSAPERVQKLVLIATSARGDTDVQAQRKAAMAAADPGTFRGLSRDAIRRSVAPDREEDTRLIERIRAMSLRLGGETFRRQSLFQRAGDTDDLPAIGCPTLIVAGQQDRLRSLEEAREMEAAIPQARLEIVGAGHMVPLEAPRKLSAVLTTFLNA